MSDIAIRVEALSKRYRIGERHAYKTLRETLSDAVSRPFRAVARGQAARPAENFIWALKDASFEVEQGDTVGIIGRNGAGKSTLLRLLSRITAPTEGSAELHGRVGALLQVGTGFHPELSGRENIYLNGAILGMRKHEIDRKFDEIVSFSEVEKFIDTPVKFYSSGMYVRLAFAVAAHLEPDILLVDEVLAVGDTAFQRKCLGKMGDVARKGRTVLFVSHNLAAVEGLCNSAYLLDQGRLVRSGETHQVVEAYLSALPQSSSQLLDRREDRQGNGRLRLTDITFRSANGALSEVVQCGQDVEFVLAYEAKQGLLQNVSLSIGVYTMGGQCMLVLINEMAGVDFETLPSSGLISCLVERFPLSPGQYTLNLYCEVNGMIADWIQEATTLTVEAGDFFGTGRLPPRTHGGILVPHRWRVTETVGPRSAQGG